MNALEQCIDATLDAVVHLEEHDSGTMQAGECDDLTV